jgi:hypothetical protein
MTRASGECGGAVRRVFWGEEVGCLDTEEGGRVVGMDCEGENMTVPQVSRVNKCCGVEEIYGSEEGACMKGEPRALQYLLNSVLSGKAGPVLLEIGEPHCPKGQVLVDYLLSGSGVRRQESEAVTLWLPGEGPVLLTPEALCLDTSEIHGLLAARLCRPASPFCSDHTCLNKCCPQGQSFLGPRCQPSSHVMNALPIYLNPVDLVPVPFYYPAFKHDTLCPSAHPLEDTPFYLMSDGSLYLPSSNRTTRSYCLDHVSPPNSTLVFLCSGDLPSEPPPTPTPFPTPYLLLSSLALFLAILAYSSLPLLYSLQGKIVLFHCAALLLATLSALPLDLYRDRSHPIALGKPHIIYYY